MNKITCRSCGEINVISGLAYHKEGCTIPNEMLTAVLTGVAMRPQYLEQMEVKKKKCKNCGNMFEQYNTLQNVCSYRCAADHKNDKDAVKEREKTESGKSRRKHLFEIARITFNAYIRERDKREPCICCGNPLGNDYQAGHYFSGGGHASVIFDEDNVHAQRKHCNEGLAGNIEGYSEGIEWRIGAGRFEVLKAKAYEVRKYEVPELQQIIREYKQKLNNLKSEQYEVVQNGD